jgi:CRP-like cAMP-binding protein
MRVETETESREARFEKLMSSLELVTARMIETAVVNSQLASSQTPQMRKMFETWIKYMSSEIARFFRDGGEVSLDAISEATGLSRESVMTLLTALDRQGEIEITHVKASIGDGKNSDICDCMISNSEEERG